jgi:hypothetical protein
VERVLGLKETERVVNVLRETFEGLTVVLLAIAFIYLAFALHKFHQEMSSG